jgi:hypothetical protein
MKCDNNKVLAMSYMLTESLNRKELLKVIFLLIGEYFRESEDRNEGRNHRKTV